MSYTFSAVSTAAVGTGLAAAFAKRGTYIEPVIWDETWAAGARGQLQSWANSSTDANEATRRSVLLAILDTDFA